MLIALVAAYLVVVLVSVAFLLPGLRNRLPFRWLRRLALLWGLIVLGYTIPSPACVYLPSVPATPAIRRVLLGEDQGQLYWLEGTTTRYTFAAGPRYWVTTTHGLCCDGGLEFIPPLRLARMDERELHWELVRSDGWRAEYPPVLDGWHLTQKQVVLTGGAVLAEAVTELRRLDRNGREWTRLSLPPGDWVLEALARTERGFVEVLEAGKFARDSHGTQRRIWMRERELDGTVVHEGQYDLADWSGGPPATAGRALFVGVAEGKTFVSQVAVGEGVQGRGRLLVLPPSGKAVEVCQFLYDPYLPQTFAMSPDARYFTNGQAVFRSDCSMVMPLVPSLLMVAWQGNEVVGVRTYPFVTTRILNRSNAIQDLIRGARAKNPDAVAHMFLSPGISLTWPEDLSRAVHQQSHWHGGVDDGGGEDVLRRVQIR